MGLPGYPVASEFECVAQLRLSQSAAITEVGVLQLLT